MVLPLMRIYLNTIGIVFRWLLYSAWLSVKKSAPKHIAEECSVSVSIFSRLEQDSVVSQLAIAIN